ncbi:hypothetical protein FEM48_Zijuj11G0012900 [Ziziphus jujuba var. spinosa]|uniref:Uncharacterized protein n=1 Tax=Ziziphus jujuba var. spinosa TaxID=714518 RepID=A0A978UG04_ZIZJJ|nr:hypothetical protein FEM48_Zijuj11G0012900 [Ziziphus jujuba var. spinosa]
MSLYASIASDPYLGLFVCVVKMAAKPLTTEAIALTEKKMDMTLDDIIKMSKNKTSRGRKQRRAPNKNQSFLKSTVQDKSTKMRRLMDSRSSLRQGVLAQRRSNFQGNQFPLAAEFARKAAVAPLRNRAFSQNRVSNWKARVAAPPVQRRAGNGGFVAKVWLHPFPASFVYHLQPPQQPMPQQQQQQGDALSKQQRPQTLDSLFANMKEQRMRVQTRKNNNNAPIQRNRNGHQRPPWGRGRFGN